MESQLILAHTIVMVISAPLALGIVPRNRYYGFRVAKTLASDEVWHLANKLAGRLMTLSSIIGIGAVRLAQRSILPLEGDILTLVSLAPMMLVISYLLFWISRQP